MATLRQYILSQSTLLPGNTVRDHIKNPISGDTARLVLVGGLEVGVRVPEYAVNICGKYSAEVGPQEYTVEIGQEYTVEIGQEYTVEINDNYDTGV